MAAGFTAAQRGLVATAAAVVFTRVLAFSLTTLGFTEHANGLMPGMEPGTADLLAGIALGAYGLTMALAQFGAGILSDRVGRKQVLLAGTALFVAGAVLCAVADGIWTLLAGRLLQGLGGVSSVAIAAVGESVPEERRTSAMALVGIPAGIAVFLGFALGPLLAGAIGFAGLFWATALLGLVAGLPFLLAPLPAPLPGLRSATQMLSMPVLGLAVAGFSANFAMTAVMFGFRDDVLADLGQTVFAAILVAAFALMGVATRLVDRSGATWQPVAAGLVLLAAAAPLFRLSAPLALAVAAGILFFAAHAFLSAALPSQVSRLAGRSGGRGHGLQLTVAYLGTFAGGATAGLFATALGYTFLALACVAALACLLVAVGLRPAAGTPVALEG